MKATTRPTLEQLRDIAMHTNDPVLREYLALRPTWACAFEPRPDDVSNFDQQSSFVFNRDAVSFLIGGNAAGTTTAAAAKTANFVLREQPPPRKNTPFWILCNTIEQVTDVCWAEKLIGNQFIPDCEIQWDRISWHDKRMGRPAAVPLKPWPNRFGGHPDKNWRLEFKSFEQGREAMQGSSIGGFWFSEQFPWDMFVEVLRGCREYMYPGGQFAEFTPIDPELSAWVEAIMDDPPAGWRFYRANTRSNRQNLAAGWFDQFFGTVSDDMAGVRMTGELASFENLIYPYFSRDLHVIDERSVIIPPGAFHALGTDWGASAEHPFVTMFGFRDGCGVWWIYDEYWSNDQTRITVDHANEVLDRCAHWGWPVIADEISRSGRRIACETSPLYSQNFADPSRPGECNAFSAYGIPTYMASNSVYEGIQHVRDLLKVQPTIGTPRLMISSRCKHLIAEMRKYRWRRGAKPGGATQLNPAVATAVPLKRDDDSCDATRYLVYSADRFVDTGVTSGRSRSEESNARGVQLKRHAESRVRTARNQGLFKQ